MTADIEGLGHPLVYKAGIDSPAPTGLDVRKDIVAIRAKMHALTGMQKEALVYHGPTGTTWRLVSDEGPYLNGTDLAPFPLAFFTAGMAFSFVNQLLRQAKAAGVTITGLRLIQDNFYTMEGSAIRGDMIGGALPVQMAIELEADASQEVISQLLARASRSSPAQAYMKQMLANTFALSHNGRALPVVKVNASAVDPHLAPEEELTAARPLPADTYAKDIIIKTEAVETRFGVAGGAGSSLQAAQKRTLHVRGTCTLRDDGLKEAKVQLLKPLGSTFQFIGDDSERERAPASLVYLAAGVGFCFLTQVGRYAHILKLALRGYSIVQDTLFSIGAEGSQAEPVDTHLFLQMDEAAEAAQQALFMSERTCFLHAAMRGSTMAQIQLTLNGRPAGFHSGAKQS